MINRSLVLLRLENSNISVMTMKNLMATTEEEIDKYYQYFSGRSMASPFNIPNLLFYTFNVKVTRRSGFE